MYSQEQMQEEFQKQLAKYSKYDENSIDKARTELQKARELVQHIESGGNSIYTVYEARQKESEARAELNDAIQCSSHLQAAKRQREHDAKLDAERAKVQQEMAVEEKKKFRVDAKQRWLAVGGTEHSFGENFESMWTEEVKRRATEHKTVEEQFIENMRASGAYGSM